MPAFSRTLDFNFSRLCGEVSLSGLVCGGQLDLATAQKAIRDNWVDAYRTYIGER
jgi:hypothetical protein